MIIINPITGFVRLCNCHKARPENINHLNIRIIFSGQFAVYFLVAVRRLEKRKALNIADLIVNYPLLSDTQIVNTL
jgi:hypothetical protein